MHCGVKGNYCIIMWVMVYGMFLDAIKAFDRGKYCKLLDVLLCWNIPPVFVHLLLNMYTSHVTRGMWNSVFLDRLLVCNGVKQGGILSPVLFCIYTDGLLPRSQIGWNFGTVYTVWRSYASVVLGVVILSIHQSICHTRALWLIQRTYWRYFYTTWKGNPSSFLTPKISAKFQRGHPRQGRQIEVG